MTFAATAHFAPAFAQRTRQPQHRRLVAALLCSGAFHALVGMAAAMLMMMHPVVIGMQVQYPAVVKATLQIPLRVPPQLEIAPKQDELIKVPLLAPAPVLPLPAPMATGRAMTSAPRPPMTLTDPNGSVTMGTLEDPQLLGGSVASSLARRYGARPDRIPRLVGSLIVPYPPEARQARASARISAVLDIDERGQIIHMTLIPDSRFFAPAVTEVLKEARFTPAEIASQPVPYWAIVEFVFAIAPEPTAITAGGRGAGPT